MSTKPFIWKFKMALFKCGFRRKYEWFHESFFCEGLHVQLAMKLFCLKTFMIYGISIIRYIKKDLCNRFQPHSELWLITSPYATKLCLYRGQMYTACRIAETYCEKKYLWVTWFCSQKKYIFAIFDYCITTGDTYIEDIQNQKCVLALMRLRSQNLQN